jgi:PAS domain S-box-containing protein
VTGRGGLSHLRQASVEASAWILLFLFLYLASLYSYLLFHSLVEFFSIVIAIGVLIVTWNARKYIGSRYLLFLGIALGFVGAIDFVHTLAYKGMNIFAGYDANLPTQLWIAARYLQAASFLVAPVFIRRSFRPGLVILAFAAITALLLASIFWGVFPDCYIEGYGLTPFKIVSEYVICAMLIASLWILYRRRQAFHGDVLRSIEIALLSAVASELCFTLYVGVFDLANLIGHLFKVVTFYYLYRAIVSTGLMRPYDLLFRDLKQSEAMLEEHLSDLELQMEARTKALGASRDELQEEILKRRRAQQALVDSRKLFQGLFEAAPDAIILSDREGIIRRVNSQAEVTLGYGSEELVGKPIDTLVPEGLASRHRKHYGQFLQEPQARLMGERLDVLCRCKTGYEFPAQITLSTLKLEDELSVISIIRDISELKQREHELTGTNRALRVLSGCNQVIVRAGSEPGLYEEICNVLVQTGGYDLALIGFPNGQVDHPVGRQFAARAPGVSIPGSGLLLTQTRQGKTPVGMALEVGKTIVIRDIEREAEASGWCAEATAMDAKSGIVLPITKLASEPGFLLILTSELNAFGPSEVALLDELVEDVAFGANALRTRAARIAAEGEIERRRDRQEALGKILMAASATNNMADLLEIPFEQTLRAFDTEVGALWLERHRVARGLDAASLKMIAGSHQSAHPQDNGGLAVEDWRKVRLRAGDLDASTEPPNLGIQSSLYVPVTHHEQKLGGLVLASREPRLWSTSEIALARSIAKEFGAAAQRHKLLEQTKGQALQLQLILDSVVDGIAALDGEHNIQLANPAAREFLSILSSKDIGGRLDQIGGRPLDSFIDTYPEVRSHEIVHKGPPDRTFDLTYIPHIEGSRYKGGLLLLRDVTVGKQEQERIVLHERLAAVGKLAAGIAHDFNNITGAIMLFSEMLVRDPQLPAKALERSNIIFSQAKRAAELTQQVLDFSRKAIMERQPMDLVPFLRGFCELMERTLPESIRIAQDYAEDEVIVSGDPGRLEQVFTNLAINARDAMPDGGVLSFRLAISTISEAGPRPFEGMAEGKWAVITVADSGHGIGPEQLPHIFEPFYTTKPPGEGTGLGLSQVYGLVRQHDGFIEVESEVDRGTRFLVYLPALVERTPIGPQKESVAVASGKGETILIVEDNESTRQALAETLEDLNYCVLQAKDGERALELIEEGSPGIDLIMSDVVMPRMGGMELYREVLERHPSIKMILITGYPLGANTQHLLEAGKALWLQKPFDSDTVSRKIRQLLGTD